MSRIESATTPTSRPTQTISTTNWTQARQERAAYAGNSILNATMQDIQSGELVQLSVPGVGNVHDHKVWVVPFGFCLKDAPEAVMKTNGELSADDYKRISQAIWEYNTEHNPAFRNLENKDVIPTGFKLYIPPNSYFKTADTAENFKNVFLPMVAQGRHREAT